MSTEQRSSRRAQAQRRRLRAYLAGFGAVSGIALVAARTETEWFHAHIWERADAILFRRNRLYFHRPDGIRAAGNAGHGSAIVAYGRECANRLMRSGIEGRLITPTSSAVPSRAESP